MTEQAARTDAEALTESVTMRYTDGTSAVWDMCEGFAVYCEHHDADGRGPDCDHVRAFIDQHGRPWVGWDMLADRLVQWVLDHEDPDNIYPETMSEDTETVPWVLALALRHGLDWPDNVAALAALEVDDEGDPVGIGPTDPELLEELRWRLRHVRIAEDMRRDDPMIDTRCGTENYVHDRIETHVQTHPEGSTAADIAAATGLPLPIVELHARWLSMTEVDQVGEWPGALVIAEDGRITQRPGYRYSDPDDTDVPPEFRWQPDHFRAWPPAQRCTCPTCSLERDGDQS